MWPFTKKIRDDDIMRIRVIVHTKSGRVHKSSWKDVSSTKFRELTDKYSFLGFGLTDLSLFLGQHLKLQLPQLLQGLAVSGL